MSTRSWRPLTAGDSLLAPSVAPSHPVTASSEPTAAPGSSASAAPPQKALTHACVRCGAPVPLDVGLCERCNPLGLKDSSASQVHGTVVIAVIVGIVLLALAGRLALAGVGPFQATFVSATPDGAGLAVTLSVTNSGSGAGQTTCRVTDPRDANGKPGAIILSPRIEPGQTVTFTKPTMDLGTTVRDLDVACSAP